MRLCPRQLRRRRSRALLLPPALLLQATQGSTGRLHHSSIMARTPLQHDWYRGQRLLLHKPQHHCQHTRDEREHGWRYVLGFWKRQPGRLLYVRRNEDT